jgi:hypothetical protein
MGAVMRKEVVMGVAEAIARSEVRGLGFNMSTWIGAGSGEIYDRFDHTGRGCGTVGCIAGWTVQLFDEEGNRRWRWWGTKWKKGDVFDRARFAMDLDGDTAKRLFLAEGITLEDVTQCQAVAVLKHLAETGEVDWRVAFPLKAEDGK